MVKFLDGPAEGVVLELARAPRFLRAVRLVGGEWDALDQLDDSPHADEAVVAYERVGPAGWVRLQMAGPKGRGRRCVTRATGEYRLAVPGPGEDVLRDNILWQAWAVAKIVEGPKP